jgi:tape measure domain-containing protein
VATIDERVVAMSFENAKFEAGVAKTMDTLAKLNAALAKVGSEVSFAKVEAESHKVTFSAPLTAIEKLKASLSNISSGDSFARLEGESHKVTFSGVISAVEKLNAKLHFPEAKSAFAELEAADDKVTFADAHGAVDSLAGHFSVLSGAAAVAMGNVISQITFGVGKAVSKSLDSIKEGFADYELKIGATQTIMAGTGESIGTVSKYLKELDEYADKTIYSLRDMTGNIGKFTNAGVKLPVAVDAMKGISNVAALSGANANEAARAMYNLGQAIGQGTVRLQDWRSVELANMGTKEFKTELIKSAEAMGSLKKQADGTWKNAKGHTVTAENFTSTLQDQWLTADVLTKTLSRYADESTNLGKRAYSAATDVKTFSMMLETLAAAAGTGWTDTFEIILGNLPEATKMWTGLTNAIGEMIGNSADARNEVLQGWKDMGGRTELLAGLERMFLNIRGWVIQIGRGFREIFPRKTAEDLMEMTRWFGDLADKMNTTDEFADKLARIFAGLFAIVDIGWQVIKQLAGVFFDLLGVLGEGSGGFVDFLAGLGDFLVGVDQAIKKGDALKGIFEGLKNVLRIPLELLKEIAGAIGEMFFGADPKKAEGVATSMEKLGDSLKPLAGVVDDVTNAWEKFVDILGTVREAVEPGITNLLDWLGNIGEFIAEKFNNMNWDDAVDAIETGLIAGIFLKLQQAIKGGLNIDFGGGMLKNLGDALGVLTDNLKAMQRGIQVATLLELAVAIGLLAGGIYILSQIPADKLSKAMGAITVGLAQLVGAIYLLTIASKGGLGFKIGVIAASMILLATAMVILAAAMKIMSTMSWEEIAKGLAGVGGGLLAIAGPIQLMNGPKLLVTAAALIPLAIALNILAVAMKIFATMSWEEMGKGLAGVALGLGAIALAMAVMPPNMILTGVGLIAISAGLILLSTAMSVFGNMDIKTMVQGLFGVAGSIMAIAGAMMLMPPNLALQAVGLLLVAVALQGIAAAVAIMGSMKIETLAKGLIALGASLLILAGGLYLMQGAIGGAAALLLAAAGLAVLGPALAFMGQLEWKTIIKGLLMMAVALGALALAGAFLSGPLIALGLALAAIGGGMLVISAALSLFVLALAQLGDKGPTAIAAMVAAFGAFLLVLPKLIIDFIKGLVVIVAEIVKVAPQIATSLVSIATTLLNAIISLSPKIAEAIGALVVLIAQVLGENAPTLIEAGFKLLIGLLTGIADNIGKVMEQATNVVVAFLEGLAQNAPRIVNAGVETLTKFLDGITKEIPSVLPVVSRMITTFLDGVTKELPKIVTSGATLIVTFLNQIANAVPRFVRAGTNIILKFMDGIEEAIPRLVKKGLAVAKAFLNGLADGMSGLADLGFKAIIRFLNGLEKAIRDNEQQLRDAGEGVADAIIDAIVATIRNGGGAIVKAITGVMKGAVDEAKEFLGIKSPSKVFMEIGDNVIAGFVAGIESGKPTMENAVDDVAKTAIKAFKSVPDLLEGIVDLDPVITPVLDLTQIEKDAKGLTDLTNVTPITAAASYSQAAAISDQQQALAESGQAAAGGTTFNYEQNNYSPESLSDVEIYRQTKNQLSQVKRGLGLAS